MSITSPIAQITSAPVASGVAWIVNVLMELNIKTTLTVWPEHWHETEIGKTEIGKDAYEHLRWHLPILRNRTAFAFEPGLEVIWHHQLDFAQHPERPTILYVRDPRDAINSLYVRLFTDTGSLSDYLRRPDSWPHHFPGLFGLPPADTWAYFNLFWMAMGEVMNVKVVCFETMRADPIGVTRDILTFLGVERSDAEIAVALEGSTFQRAKEAMEKLQQETGSAFHTNRKGQVGEWKEVYTPTDLLCFAGPAAYAMRKLGYGLPEVIEAAEQQANAAFDTRCIPPQIDATVQAAIQLSVQGDASGAEALLLSNLSETNTNPWAQTALLNALTSLRWTRIIFTDSHMASAPAQRAFQLFLDLNFRFFGYPAIQEALQHGQYGWSDTPNLLEKFAEFNIVHYHHTFYGLSPALGEVDLPFTDAATLQAWRKAGTLITGRTPQEVRRELSGTTVQGVSQPETPIGLPEAVVSVVAVVNEPAQEKALYLCDLSQGLDVAQRELKRLPARPQLADLVEANALTVLSLGERNAIGPNFAVVDLVHPDPDVVQTLVARNFSMVVLPYRNRLYCRGMSLVRFALQFTRRLMILFPDNTVRTYEHEGAHRLLYNTAYLDNMFRYIPRPVGGEALEVGCSDGMVCDLMLKEGPRSLVGIDMMDSVGCNFPDPRITYAHMDATAMTFASGRFDCAYSIATMEHVANPFQALLEMRRVLKRGGYGYVQAGPFYHSPFGHHMFGLFDTTPWIHIRRSKEEIIALGKATGIDARILRERGQNIETYVDGMINPLHINGLLPKQYRLEEFMALPDVETLHFERSFEGRELLTPAICAELPQFSEDDLTAHGFELMFRIR